MHLARASKHEIDPCDCEPIDGARCTEKHNCLNRLSLSECAEVISYSYYLKSTKNIRSPECAEQRKCFQYNYALCYTFRTATGDILKGKSL